MNFRVFFNPITIRFIVCITFFLYLTPAIAATLPGYEIGESPAWKIQIPTPNKVDATSGDVTYLLLDCQKNMLLRESNYRYILQLNNEEGVQNNSQITMTFDPSYQNLIINKILIHRGNQVINHLNRSEIEIMRNEKNTDRFIYDGTYSAINILKDVRKGDILEYEYTIKGENPIFGNYIYSYVDLSYSSELKRNYQRIIVPSSEKLVIQPIQNGQQPEILENGNTKSLVWDLSDCPAVYTDANIPSWYDVYAACEVSSYGNWSNVKQWGIKLYPYDIATPEIDEFIAARKTEHSEQGIISIIRFVQDEIRYLGIEIGNHSHQPHNPEEVLRNRFGDCKDKSYLLVVMLRKIGVQAWPAYTNTYKKAQVKNCAASPFAFNHVIVKFRWKDKEYWVDPTISQQRGPLSLLDVPGYRNALVLDNNENGLEDIPFSTNAKVVIKEFLTLPDSASSARYRVVTTYYGNTADSKRSNHTGTPISEIRENYINYCSSYYPSLKWANDSALQFVDHADENSFQVIESYLIPDFWSHSETDSVDFFASIYAYNLYEFLSTSKDKSRTMPLAVYYPVDVNETIEIHFPKYKQIGFKSRNDSIVNHAFSFYFTTEVDRNQHRYTLNYHYRSKADNVPVNEQKAYFKDYTKLSNLCEEYIQWGVESKPDKKISWIAVIVSVLFMGLAALIIKQLYRLNLGFQPTGKRPIPFGGWLIIPIIGIYITPISIIIQIFRVGFFSRLVWDNFMAQSDSIGTFLMGSFFYFELIFNLSLIIFSVFLIILQIKRRASFPTFYIWFRLVSIIGLLFDTALSIKVLNVKTTDDFSTVIREFVGVAIWVPYFLMSTRVKDTFVTIYKTPVLETESISESGCSNIQSVENSLSENNAPLPD